MSFVKEKKKPKHIRRRRTKYIIISRRKKKMEKSKKTDMAFIASMNDDLLQNILLRLPAKPFAFASCVNRSWNIVCNRILSRPKMVSAFSRNPHQFVSSETLISCKVLILTCGQWRSIDCDYKRGTFSVSVCVFFLLQEAVEEAIDKALSDPIRPDFVIANITCGNMEDTLSLVYMLLTSLPTFVFIDSNNGNDV